MPFIAATIAASAESKAKVCVTGAGGRTGSLVFKKLTNSTQYSPIGVVRSDASKAALMKKTGATDPDQIIVGDILGSNGAAVLDKAMAGADALVIATSVRALER